MLISLILDSYTMCTKQLSLLDIRVLFDVSNCRDLVGYTARCQIAVKSQSWPYDDEEFTLSLSHLLYDQTDNQALL